MVLRLLRDDESRPASRATRAEPSSRERERIERQVTCASCGHGLTSSKQRTELMGRHRHTCVNPESIVFVVCCFRRAPGARVVGPAETRFSWFAGYAWQIACCAACGAHVGWRYVGDAPEFFGLIEDRIVER